MYFPYLRAKQFELIALRELLENKLIGENIFPIIEPLKLSPTLIKTMEHYTRENRLLGIVQNPKVGNFLDNFDEGNENRFSEAYKEIMRSPYLVNCYVTNENFKTELNQQLSLENLNNDEIILIHDSREYLNDFSLDFSILHPKYNLVPDESIYRRTVKKNRILFRDKFIKQSRNTDYTKIEDEFYSDDHLYFMDEGYEGFADYSIIGAEYSEAGFAPYAVAIHIVYFDVNKNLRIKHFVSDSNKDTRDPAGKFGEALKKLVECYELSSINTYGLNQFRYHYDNGTYPGLGTVKKLSVMHHFELISRYLDEVKQ
ncbi:sce7725 family protein [Paenibacillus sp. AGC30]